MMRKSLKDALGGWINNLHVQHIRTYTNLALLLSRYDRMLDSNQERV